MVISVSQSTLGCQIKRRGCNKWAWIENVIKTGVNKRGGEVEK